MHTACPTQVCDGAQKRKRNDGDNDDEQPEYLANRTLAGISRDRIVAARRSLHPGLKYHRHHHTYNKESRSH